LINTSESPVNGISLRSISWIEYRFVLSFEQFTFRQHYNSSIVFTFFC